MDGNKDTLCCSRYGERKYNSTYIIVCGALVGGAEGVERPPWLSGNLEAPPHGNIREKAFVTLLDRAGGSGGAGGGMKPGAEGRSGLSAGGFDIVTNSQPPSAWIYISVSLGLGTVSKRE